MFWAKAANTLRELVGCGTAHRSSVPARYDTCEVYVSCSVGTSRIRKPSTDMIWKFGKSYPRIIHTSTGTRVLRNWYPGNFGSTSDAAAPCCMMTMKRTANVPRLNMDDFGASRSSLSK